MELIIDANILFSALIKDRTTRKIILFSDYSFFIPEFIFEELNKHKGIILEKAHISEEELKEVFNEIIENSNIQIIPKSEFNNNIMPAKEITPDPDDVHYFALALKLNCPIWSNDKDLKKQNNVKVYSTEDILNLLSKGL